MRIVQVSAGLAHAAAIVETGVRHSAVGRVRSHQMKELFTWGSSEFGQCGHGVVGTHYEPHLVEDLRGKVVVQVSCGHSHTMCVTDMGEVFAWGNNTHGELGLGVAGNSLRPKRVDIAGKQKAVQVACGGTHSLILLDRGQVYACGSGRDGTVFCASSLSEYSVFVLLGRLGLGATDDQMLPHQIESLSSIPIIAVAAGTDFSLVLSGAVVSARTSSILPQSIGVGDVYGFGSGAGGQLGIMPPTVHLAPVPIPDLQGRRVVRLSALGTHCLAITEKGVVYAWGTGDFGQLGIPPGIGQGTSAKVPKLVGALSDHVVIAAAAGYQHSAFVTDDGTLYTSGNNDLGQLGQGHDRMLLGPRPVKALQGVSVSHVACGGRFTLVLVR